MNPLAELFQLLAALEIVHAGLGLVGGSLVTALMQWAGRSNVLFGVVMAVPEVSGVWCSSPGCAPLAPSTALMPSQPCTGALAYSVILPTTPPSRTYCPC